MPTSAYSKSARKTQASFKSQYGAKWKQVYYATANKRSGGRSGTNRGAKSANFAFKKGAHWSKSGKRVSVGRKTGAGKARGLRVR